jgi:hypothetical protein
MYRHAVTGRGLGFDADASVPILRHAARLLDCSKIGTADFPTYAGEKSMYEVHKCMALDRSRSGTSSRKSGSAASFSVATADVEAVAKALMDLFGYRCASLATVVPLQGPQLENIFIAVCCCVVFLLRALKVADVDLDRIIVRWLQMGIARSMKKW